MKIKLICSYFLTCLFTIVNAQELKVIANSGGNFKNASTSIDWTLGETAITTLTDEETKLTQGFHQPEITVNSIQEQAGYPFAIEAYPNPANKLLLIKLENSEILNFQYIFYDINGKVLEQNKASSDISAIDISKYPSGTYLLKILLSESEIKTFEIIKN